jgi:hypothetical protein
MPDNETKAPETQPQVPQAGLIGVCESASGNPQLTLRTTAGTVAIDLVPELAAEVASALLAQACASAIKRVVGATAPSAQAVIN